MPKETYVAHELVSSGSGKDSMGEEDLPIYREDSLKTEPFMTLFWRPHSWVSRGRRVLPSGEHGPTAPPAREGASTDPI